MSDWLLQLITILPEGTSYLLLIALISFLESLPALGIAVPGSTLIVLSGFLAAHGKSDLLALIAVSATGAFCGDAISFLLGKRLGIKILAADWIKKRQPKIDETKVFLIRHGGKSLLYARFLGPIRGTVPFLAGIAEMKWLRFSKTTLLGAILWGLTYPGLGYLGGESWQKAGTLSTRLGLIIILCFCATIFHLWLKRKTH